MADGWRQLRLLLWKDYLIRKRKWITLAGVLWASAVMMTLYIVRANIDNVNYKTCQYPARALPSAGMLTFLQSFICSINNECNSMDQYEEIPTYENSKLTQLQRKFSPLLYNESVLETAAAVPDALKLISKLAEVVDEPTFLDVIKNGLKVEDLFTNPARVKRYLTNRLEISNDVAQSVMKSEINIWGILKGFSRCDKESLSNVLTMSEEHMEILATKVCSLSSEKMQSMVMDLVLEVNLNKYIKMLGNMYYNLNGDLSISELADMVTAVLRMMRIQNFLPKELGPIFDVDVDFSYVDLGLIQKFLDLFKPTFSDSEGFISIKEFADATISAVRYFSEFLARQHNNTVEERTGLDEESKGLKSIGRVLGNAVDVLKESTTMNKTVDVFEIVSKFTNFVYKWLPDGTKHEVLLYSTLLTKLVEGTGKVVRINMEIEQGVYNVALRHPGAMKLLVALPTSIVAKGLQGLTDAERTQLVSAKINAPDQFFCDQRRLTNFFKITKDEASSLKEKLCTEAWKAFVIDLAKSFGVYDVKEIINSMVSIFIQETLGKDNSEMLYSLDYDFQVIRNFTKSLSNMDKQHKEKPDWNTALGVSEDSEFMKAVRKEQHLAKQILITVHGCLAREVVKQNVILSFKISPILIDMNTIVTAINKQLDMTDKGLVERMKELYPAIVEMLLSTALSEDKTYKSISTHSTDMLCNGVENATKYIEIPPNVDAQGLVTTLCDMSDVIEKGMANGSLIGNAIDTIKRADQDTFNEVPWTNLVTGLKNLYVKVDRDYPYVLQYATYGMDEAMRTDVLHRLKVLKKFWFRDDLGRSVHLSIKLLFRLLDLLDRDILHLDLEPWLKVKYSLHVVSGPLFILDDVIKTVTGIYHNSSAPPMLPPITSAALALAVPRLPGLVGDAVELLRRDDTDVAPIISLLNTEPRWPCSAVSIGELLNISAESKTAVRGVETLVCLSKEIQDEWISYLDTKDLGLFNINKFNTTKLSAHVYLRFSAAFDSLLEDSSLLLRAVQDMAGDGVREASWDRAVGRAIEIFAGSDRDTVIRNFFTKLDTVLEAIDTSPVHADLALNSLWMEFFKCASAGYIDDDCKMVARAAGKYSLKFLSVLFDTIATDLLVYFKEVNEPDASVLQIMGFTKSTPLYELYQKLPEFTAVLLNSYFDYGFMSQIRRASVSQFWDCAALTSALAPPAASDVSASLVSRVRPYVCPSLLYWITLPRGENVLIDVVAKPNYYLFLTEVAALRSNYVKAYNKTVELSEFLANVTNVNATALKEDDLKINTLQHKLNAAVEYIVNYKINETDVSYRLFNDVYRTQFASNVYLTRIVVIVNKIMSKIDNLTVANVTDSSDEAELKKAKTELIAVKNIFRRKPDEAIAMHFDVITNLVWKVNDYYSLTGALDTMCDDWKKNVKSKDILVDEQDIKEKLCTKNYKLYYKGIDEEIVEDLDKAKKSLMNFVTVLLNDDNLDNVTDINEFLTKRSKLTATLLKSISYSYDLSIPIYLQYLQSNLQHYDIILSFLSGGDWWTDLRQLYNGTYATKFFDSAEKSFDIAEDVLGGLDRIHLIRLLHDIHLNDSEAFCEPTIVLSDYLPDTTGVISQLKFQLCEEENTEVLREIPPLVFASQGFDSSLTLSRVVNYTAINRDITSTESRLAMLRHGPSTPQRPHWVTQENIDRFKKVATNLLSKETMTRVSFAVLSNLVDGGTLFLKNSSCTLCSQTTSWFKQINLQVFKKQEYDALLCRMGDMALPDVYHTLQTDFHWDMAIRELISTRNYTKYELNKSMNEFLELVKLHMLEDMLGPATKLSECLAHNVTRNEFGNVTLFLSVLSHTARLLRSVTPHLHHIEGLKDLPYLKQLHTEVAHNLDVDRPLKRYLKKELTLTDEAGDFGKDILDGDLNLRLLNYKKTVEIKLHNSEWYTICYQYNCSEILNTVFNNINRTLVERELPKLQSEEFWRFTFASRILYHLETLLAHASRLSGVASRLDVAGVVEGRMAALIDFGVHILMDDNTNAVLYSLSGLVEELHPLLEGVPLELDLAALARGLAILHDFKNYMLDKQDLRVEVSKFFSSPERVEAGLSRLGINNTNFWSVAAPRIHAGYIDVRPVLSSKQPTPVATYVCQVEPLCRIIRPASLDVVSAEDVCGATVEQLCGITDQQAKGTVAVLLGGLDLGAVVDKVKDMLLPQIFAAANLSEAEGALVLDRYPRMAALLPIIQENVGELTDTIAKEPLIKDLGGSSSLAGLLASPQFLSNAGAMLCGKPFKTDMNRFYKAIAESKDYSNEPNAEQLEVLPTDFCRDLYREIVGMAGGKIVWSFVKPLLMGRILYTPQNALTQKIMAKANATFAHAIRLTSLIHSFSDSFSSVESLSTHREGVGALKELFNTPAVRQMLLGDQAPGGSIDVDLDSVFGDLGDVQGIGKLLSKGSELLRCVRLDRFRASPTEYDLTHEAAMLSRVDEFSAGIVFHNTEDQSSDDPPLNVEYTIRMDIDSVPSTARLKSFLWIPGPEANFLEDMRYFRGFVQIQDLMDSAIIDLSRSHARQKREIENEVKWATYTQQEPYPCYKKDFFQTSLYESQALIVSFVFSLLFTVASVVRFIVADTESGNTMLMSIMGVNLRFHTFSWFLASLLELLVTVCCITAILVLGGILPRTSPSLILALLVVFAVSVLSFCYMMSRLFRTASAAAVVSALAYLSTFMPFVVVLSLEAVLALWRKVAVCLSMSSAICYAFLQVVRLEAAGHPAGWAQLWAEAGGMSIGAAAAMALFDAALYLIIGMLIDRYFGPRTLRTSVTHTHSPDAKAGVSIVNVSAYYGKRRALAGVSAELRRGQVTALLGHNGAGKTTLIKILTGALKPSSGHVTIRSTAAGSRLGVCPQRDVLFDCLTPAEHVALYAQLKSGLSLAEVQAEVDSMLSVLSLGSWASTAACRLSGGTRRRLCVALAFVARPDLVVLDEPTAGVDPSARRAIWSMVSVLRGAAARTVLLCTHHLDEAELLADQILIMHKGLVHTRGSPIEIKRGLGCGYRLALLYPEKRDSVLTWEDGETWLEERSKRALAAARAAVANAALADATAAQIEITLPFFDSDGANNDFLGLCKALESQQAALGFSHYTMDCSSLEQVFFSVCQQADGTHQTKIDYDADIPSKSASTSSIDSAGPLVPADGVLKGTAFQQFLALLHARYTHYRRNRWLLFLLLVLPSLFVAVAMGFSMVRPPADNQVSLPLTTDLYAPATQYQVPNPTIYSRGMDPSFAQQVMANIRVDRRSRNWTMTDTPQCNCTDTRQDCAIAPADYNNLPEMMVLPDVGKLNDWIVASHDIYIEKRYGGFSTALKNNVTNLVAWYNNKGRHALPAYMNALSTAALRAVSGEPSAGIVVRSHPLKISKEELSKDTVYQHVADAGIAALVLVAYCLVSGGAAIYLVGARESQEKRLQLLCGVSPALYWAAALAGDMAIILINLLISVVVFEAFGFPVFVARNNLPAICILILLYGYACANFVHVAEKMFSEPSVASMILFCGNAFVGLAGIALLLILDVISDSDATDNARWALHKVFLLSPQFALGDGLIELAKNTIQAQVLDRFGMDTYADPLSSSLLALHYTALAVVGTALLAFNLAIEYDWFEVIVTRFQPAFIPAGSDVQDPEVLAERRRVRAEADQAPERAVRLPTIGNINAGFVDTEVKNNSIKRVVSEVRDVAQTVELSKVYPALNGPRVALRSLTLGIPPAQCTALLGENGAGKSTTFALLTGSARASAGRLRLAGRPAGASGLRKGLISYCPQSDAVDPLLTVTETLAMFCRLRGLADRDQVIKRTLDMFELRGWRAAPAGALSGGNRRKLCSALAFMGRTPLVLLDEPTSGMDPAARACVSRGVLAARSGGRGALLSSHALDDARRLAARVALLRRGELVALAGLDDCLRRFGGGYVVCCRCPAASAAWREARARAPQAVLKVMHENILHFLVPTQATVGDKEVTTKLSDVFALMAALQAACDVEDYTVNQSSLDQMFLSFSERGPQSQDPDSPDSVTSL